MKSEKFDLVKKYYDENLWSIEQTRNAVNKEWITIQEFEHITLTSYSE